MNFDYLSKEFKRNDPAEFFALDFRIVRFEVSENSYEMLVTNLSKEDFEQLYAMRDGK